MLSISTFGVTNNINYLPVLQFISRRGSAFYPNHSINGLLNRLMFNGGIDSNVNTNSFPLFYPWVYSITTVSSIALIATALFYSKKTTGKGSAINFCIIALTSTISSPIAWEHHYGILLPIYALILPCLLKNKVLGEFTTYCLCLSYLLASNYFPILKLMAAYAPWNIVQSYLFFAASIVLVYLYMLRNIPAKMLIDRKSAGGFNLYG